MDYQREAPAADQAAIDATRRHVRDYLAAAADADDDPQTRAEDVDVWVIEKEGHPDTVIVRGTLDAEPVADYLQPGYDPLAGVPQDLLTAPGAEEGVHPLLGVVQEPSQ